MSYITPTKRIFTPEDLSKWVGSPTYNTVLDFIVELQSSVTGKSNDSSYETSLIIDKLSKLLSKVDNLITLHPAHDSVSRFGKIEFRDFYSDLSSKAEEYISEIATAIQETSAYFIESWGTAQELIMVLVMN